MKLETGLPKSVVNACVRAELKFPGSIGEVFTEDNGMDDSGRDLRDIWVHVNPGFHNPVDGVHAIHEVDRKFLCWKIGKIARCSCEDCVKSKATE